ncbi:MAG: Hsp20/alpha crystallin family protein [Promethearchaeota archaeon]
MNDKTKDHNEDDNYGFFCFPPFNALWKGFPHIKPFKKGFSPFGYWSTQGSRVPITHVKRDHEKYHITMEIPGISRDEINLEATSDELWFSAESTNFKNQYTHHLHFKKQIRPIEIKAHLKTGILTISLPFTEKVPKTKVDVE